MNIKFVSTAFLSVVVLLGGAGFAQRLIRFEKHDLTGYKDARGRVRIPARYILADDFSREGIAAVLDTSGWSIIDRRGRVLVDSLFIFDNGPDEFVENLARFTRGGKFGFYDRRGRIVVEPQFDFAGSFQEGASAVCDGCKKTVLDTEGHYVYGGGRWGFIDRRGAIIVPLRYETVENFKNGRALVTAGGKQSSVNKHGAIIER